MLEDNTLPPPPRRERTASIEGTRSILNMLERNSEQGSERLQEPTRMQRVKREFSLLLIPGLTLAGLFFYFRWVHTFFKDLFPNEVAECSADPVSYICEGLIWNEDHMRYPEVHASLRHEGMTQADFMYQISLFAAVPAVALALFSYFVCRYGVSRADNSVLVIRESVPTHSPAFLPPPPSEGASVGGSHASTPTKVTRGEDQGDLLRLRTPTRDGSGSRK